MVVSDELRSLSVVSSVRSGVVDPEVERGDGRGRCRDASMGVGGLSLSEGATSMKTTSRAEMVEERKQGAVGERKGLKSRKERAT